MSELTIFLYNKNIISLIAQIYQRSEKTLREDVLLLKKWMESQPHLPEILDEKRIQNFLIFNKFSIERAKRSIDMYYTLRSHIPEIYKNANPKNPKFKMLMDIVHWVILPKLTKEMYRVSWFKVHNKNNAELIDPYQLVKIGCIIQEVRLKEDVIFGDVCVFDLEHLSLSYFLKLTPTYLAKVFLFYEKIYSIPLKGLYFLNSPQVFNSVLGIVKTVIKPKIFERIHVCKDTSILNEIFPKDMIPQDYGGEEKSLQELSDLMKLKLQQYQDHFDHLDRLKVDESLRPEKLKNDEILGFYGNFKKLDVD